MKKPKFEIGQEVYFLCNNSLTKMKIQGYYLRGDAEGPSAVRDRPFHYCLENPAYRNNLSNWMEENELFGSKEELRDHIFGKEG